MKRSVLGHSGDAVFISHQTLPGGYAPYNLGATLTHEMGHYFGLLHTFHGGCDEPGDHIGDTPAVATPNYGCPQRVDSCPNSPGADMVDNFMVHVLYSLSSLTLRCRTTQATTVSHGLLHCRASECVVFSPCSAPGYFASWMTFVIIHVSILMMENAMK